jgi:hypothetical protein
MCPDFYKKAVFTVIAIVLIAMTAAAQAPSKKGGGGGSPFDAEARIVAGQLFQAEFRKCGSSFVAYSQNDVGPDARAFEVNSVQVGIKAEPLDAADVLNGVHWRGVATAQFTAMRPLGQADWEPPGKRTYLFRMAHNCDFCFRAMYKRKDQWMVERYRGRLSQETVTLDNFLKELHAPPSCEGIAR